jgi:hypothetical protein
MTALYPTFEIPDEVTDELTEEVAYPTSFDFDFEAGDFVTHGGRVATTDGYRAWVQWCVKAALTERGAYLVYTDDYGADTDELPDAASRAEAESLLENTITEALEVDPRTGSVSNFTFEWNGDGIGVSFTLEPTIGTNERIDITIRR